LVRGDVRGQRKEVGRAGREERKRERERERDRRLSSRLLVSEANASTLLFLDRMVLAVNGYLCLDG